MAIPYVDALVNNSSTVNLCEEGRQSKAVQMTPGVSLITERRFSDSELGFSRNFKQTKSGSRTTASFSSSLSSPHLHHAVCSIPIQHKIHIQGHMDAYDFPDSNIDGAIQSNMIKRDFLLKSCNDSLENTQLFGRLPVLSLSRNPYKNRCQHCKPGH